MIVFTNRRHKLKLVRAPKNFPETLADFLRDSFSRKVERAGWSDDVYKIDFRDLESDRKCRRGDPSS